MWCVVMFRYKYWYCKARMTAYIHGELPPRSRQRMARFIDECPLCYREYQRQSARMRELQRGVPLLGRPDPARLDRIWAGVQAELARPTASAPPPPRHYTPGYGFAALLLVMLLVFPWALGRSGVQSGIPQQPSPDQSALAATPVRTAGGSAPTAVALVLTASTEKDTSILLQNTPAPQSSGR